MAAISHFLDDYLDPIAEAFSPEVAVRFLKLEPSASVLARIEELADKSNAGTLSDGEWDEYRLLANVGTLVAVLKAKARKSLLIR
jgi:hypothetical protein